MCPCPGAASSGGGRRRWLVSAEASNCVTSSWNKCSPPTCRRPPVEWMSDVGRRTSDVGRRMWTSPRHASGAEIAPGGHHLSRQSRGSSRPKIDWPRQAWRQCSNKVHRPPDHLLIQVLGGAPPGHASGPRSEYQLSRDEVVGRPDSAGDILRRPTMGPARNSRLSAALGNNARLDGPGRY